MQKNWLSTFSIPKNLPHDTPEQRERIRYARLTSCFIFILFCLDVADAPVSFINVHTIWSPINATLALLLVVLAYPANKVGWNIVAASLLVAGTMVGTWGAILANPLDPAFVAIFCALVVPVILAGSLMPPIAAVFAAIVNSIAIILTNIFQTRTPAFDIAVKQNNIYGISLALPLGLIIVVAAIMFMIMRNLGNALNRAEKAEEIIELQKQITEYERDRSREKQQLEQGIALIAHVHAQIANGNLDARVPMESEDGLWQVTVPLNNLLNRVQRWKENADRYEQTQQAITTIVSDIQVAKKYQKPLSLHRTNTPLDPLLIEINLNGSIPRL